jgi:hypothetical protein
MSAIDHWLNWRPSAEKFGSFPECEPPKPPKPTFEGFEGSIAGQVNNFSAHPPSAPDAWREDFSRWLDSACVCSPRDFGGLNRLHIAFCELEVQRGEVPCTRDTFERLLTERGFLIGEVCGVLLVSGLTFREDFEVYR